MATGTCTSHVWNDGAEQDESDLGMGRRVNARLEHDTDYYRSATSTRTVAPGSRAGFMSRLVRRQEGEGEDGW